MNEVLTFCPGAGQSRVFTTESRFIFAMGGKRGGKTTVGCYFANTEMVKLRRRIKPTGVDIVASIGLIAAPTVDQLKQSTLAKFFEEFPQYKKYYREYKNEIRIPFNASDGTQRVAVIYTRSLDIAKNIEGMNLDWIWVDEADSLDSATWNVVRGRVATTLGKILCTTTIYPVSWIFDRVYKRKDPGYEIITWPSSENPAFPEEEWATLKAETDPLIFAREYEAQFIFASGLVYPGIDEYGFVSCIPEGVTVLATFFGIDYGLNDDTVVLCDQYCSDGAWYTVHETVRPAMNVDEINQTLNSYVSLYGQPWQTWYDPAGGIAVLSIDPKFNPHEAVKKLNEGITLITNLIFQKRIYCLDSCPKTQNEYRRYSYDNKKMGVPEDRNNHTMDNNRYIINSSHAAVDGLKSIEEKKALSTLWRALEEEGYLKDGQFQNKIDGSNYFNEEYLI